ncbi:MAG: UDP-N-acetylmuramate:L-alanyl-gamma-D-glutamyl-meso-diaminopimelate ligase [Burkholderiaceae bacterium]|nr:UDP-N-acetylmuramate:L-alanyl-gamma-D-glutamyl-meso-diaminopimelate ligase [Burkholderiaceae bacterium]
MHIHILGICGTFMGGLAVLAQQAGHTVTGCDANVYPPMSTQLQSQGIQLTEGYGVEQLALAPDLFVIGNVVSRGNPLMEAILNRGLPYISGPQWMGEHILRDKWVLAVAGTHGKTTTSAMLAWILEFAGYAPGFLIGGVPMNFAVSARLSGANNVNPAQTSDFFVIEADEYDTAFFDKRSKFVHYHAKTAILNNLEYDHADIFPDIGAIETQFHHLVRTVPGIGRLIVNQDDAALARVMQRGCWSEKEGFGQAHALDGQVNAQAAWTLQLCDETAGEDFEVFFQGESQGIVRWQLNGAHNRMNALAAIAAARHVGVHAAVAIEALAQFENVKRRMEVRGVAAGVTVVDDFAHHPTAIAATVQGLRRKLAAGSSPTATRILAVLEPRSNTMKLGVMKQALADSLAEADLVFAYSAMQANSLTSAAQSKAWSLADALSPLGAKLSVHNDIAQLVQALVSAALPGDHILVMSNGGFGGIHEKLLTALNDKALAAVDVKRVASA